MSSFRGLGTTFTVFLAGLIGLLGAGLVWAALCTSATPPQVLSQNSPTGEATSSTAPRPSARTEAQPKGKDENGGHEDRITGPVLSESVPLEVGIPRLGVQSGLVELGIDQAGAMEVPSGPAAAGWYNLGPAPGALGPAVIAGHVTWNQAPAVFFRLSMLQKGDRVTVTREDGRTAVFSVRRISRFAKSQFPTDEVFGAIDHAGLRLITCGGEYDDSAHRYLDNVVVFARLIAERRQEGGNRETS